MQHYLAVILTLEQTLQKYHPEHLQAFREELFRIADVDFQHNAKLLQRPKDNSATR